MMSIVILRNDWREEITTEEGALRTGHIETAIHWGMAP
jgi:hypothetical protein